MGYSEWKEYKLGDLIMSANTGLDAIKRAPIVNNDTGIKCLRIQDISQKKYFFDWGFCDVTKDNFKKFQLKENDLLIARTGETVGVNRLINKNICAVFNNGLIRIRTLNEKLLPRFLYYLCQSNDFKNHVHSIARGTSTQPNMRIGALLDFKLILPEIQIQNKIALILSSLDDKIELNRQTNKTLVAIAQTLFKEMCVPKNEVLPKGWEVVQLNKVLEIKYGKDHKHLENGTIPLYGSGGIMRFVNKALYEEESILIPRKGTLSNLFYINKPFWSVDTMFYTKIKDRIYSKFLFLLLKSMNLAAMNVGSAVPSLTTEILNRLDIIIPSIDVLKKFDEIVTPFFNMLDANEDENQTHILIRDGLLPKLMKGEIII